jgi:iron-sulfur cluster repair protein YtfE (RIC family)
MTQESLRTLLAREHRAIDGLIETYAHYPGTAPAERHALGRAVACLRRHIYLEEELLFPALAPAGLAMAVLVMQREHAEMWETLDTLDQMLAGGNPDGDALAWSCRQLLAQLQAHNPKEEAILYPQTDTMADPALSARVRQFLDDGRLPVGWCCRHLQP